MKKLLPLLLLIWGLVTVPVVQAQAQTQWQMRPEFTSLSFIYSGTVVNVQEYVNIREQPTVKSRIVARAPLGAKLTLRFVREDGWWQVLDIDGDNYGVRAGDAIGYIHDNFVRTK